MRFLLGLALTLLTTNAQAALTASAIIAIDSAGSSTGACIFDAGVAVPGIDRSQDAASFDSGSDLASSNGTTNPCVVTSATHTFDADDEGNAIIVTAGTSWTVQRAIIVDTSAGAATLDRACGSVAGLSSGTWKMGGACSLNNNTAGISDDALFEMGVSGNIFYAKNGNYTVNLVVMGNAGTPEKPINIEGFASARGDRPTGSTRPLFSLLGNNFTLGANIDIRNVQFTSATAAGPLNGLTSGIGSKIMYVKAINPGDNTGRIAITLQGSNSLLFASEASSYRGQAVQVNTAGTNVTVIGNYFHDSDVCVHDPTTSVSTVYIDNIYSGCVTVAHRYTAAKTGLGVFAGNTIHGANNKLGNGLTFAAGITNAPHILNNIFTGLITALSAVDVAVNKFSQYNNFYNNTTDRSNFQAGTGDLAVDPAFKNVTQVLITTATTSSATNTLTKVGATFQTNGVIAGRDYLYISATTGTVGVYGIASVDSQTQLTLDNNPGNSTGDVTAQITVGRDYTPGTNMRAVGYPGAFSGGTVTGYKDMGAVQRRERATISSGH